MDEPGQQPKRLNEQVKRNRGRFPGDFMFQLTVTEAASLRSQIATSKPGRSGRGGRRHRPHAFTEHGALMVATVLNSPHAVEMSVFVVRAFVRLRELLSSNAALSRRLDDLEASLARRFITQDETIAAILSAIRELMRRPVEKRRGIGFTAEFNDEA